MTKDTITDQERQNLVATALNAGGKLQFGVVSLAPGALETYTREIVRRTTDAIAQQRGQPSSLWVEGRDGDGRVVLRGGQASADPQGDHMLMDGFLTLEQAHRIRGVDIAYQLGSLYVVSRKPATFDEDAVAAALQTPKPNTPGEAS